MRLAFVVSLLLTGACGISVTRYAAADASQGPLSTPAFFSVQLQEKPAGHAHKSKKEPDASTLLFDEFKKKLKKDKEAERDGRRTFKDANGNSHSCPADETFFKEGLALHLRKHPNQNASVRKEPVWNPFLSHGFVQKREGYVLVDRPWSSEANRLSMELPPVMTAEAAFRLKENAVEKSLENPDNDEGRSKRDEELRDEARESKRRELIRKQKQWSESRIDQQKVMNEQELMMKHQQAGEAFDDIGVWYINMDDAKKRRECLEHQFAGMTIPQKIARFPAVEFPRICTDNEADMDEEKYEECLHSEGLGDCIESGIDYESTATHGSAEHNKWEVRSHVLSNWCGHKRLWRKLEEDSKNSTAGRMPKYLVFLEDDVILDRDYFLTVVRDFASNYKDAPWDLVQIDPFGGKAPGDLFGHWRGKPVFKPTKKDKGSGVCSEYWGFHAVLVKTAALPRINEWMSSSKALPIDWLPWNLPNALAFSGLVARNPEARLFGNVIVLPEYCAQEVTHTSIG